MDKSSPFVIVSSTLAKRILNYHTSLKYSFQISILSDSTYIDKKTCNKFSCIVLHIIHCLVNKVGLTLIMVKAMLRHEFRLAGAHFDMGLERARHAKNLPD